MAEILNDDTGMEEAQRQSLTVWAAAKELRVINASSYVAAGDLWKGIRDLRQKITDTFGPIIEMAHKAHKTALAKKAEADKPLEEA